MILSSCSLQTHPCTQDQLFHLAVNTKDRVCSSTHSAVFHAKSQLSQKGSFVYTTQSAATAMSYTTLGQAVTDEGGQVCCCCLLSLRSETDTLTQPYLNKRCNSFQLLRTISGNTPILLLVNSFKCRFYMITRVHFICILYIYFCIIVS